MNEIPASRWSRAGCFEINFSSPLNIFITSPIIFFDIFRAYSILPCSFIMSTMHRTSLLVFSGGGGGVLVLVSTGVDVKMSVGDRVRVGLGVGGSSVVVG